MTPIRVGQVAHLSLEGDVGLQVDLEDTDYISFYGYVLAHQDHLDQPIWEVSEIHHHIRRNLGEQHPLRYNSICLLHLLHDTTGILFDITFRLNWRYVFIKHSPGINLDGLVGFPPLLPALALFDCSSEGWKGSPLKSIFNNPSIGVG